MKGKRRIVLLSSHVPDPSAGSAGVRYLNWLTEALDDCTITVIAPDAPANRDAMTRPHPVERLLVTGGQSGRRRAGTAAETWRRLTPVRPPAGFVDALIRNARARELLHDADVVDLQWPEMSPLVRRIRRLAPRARVIATLHDVASQRYSRQARALPRLRARSRALMNALHARAVERHLSRQADAIVVFSDKDESLLPPTAPVDVVYPPLAAEARRMPATGSPDETARVPTAVLIGPLTRLENLDAARWLVRDIWPSIQRSIPDARLIIAGQAEPGHRADLSRSSGVEVTGFVESLDGIYLQADVVLAPMRAGAGVKFKVVDALARGIPVVTTAVGAEGIGDATFHIQTYDGAASFSAAVIDALNPSDETRQRAAEARAWAVTRYGAPQFEQTVRGIYGVPARVEQRTPVDPSVSIVIPVRNGEHGIARQLAALARQAEALAMEVVVSDNGSTDRTVQMAEAFASSFAALRVVDAGDRTGVSHARNVGIQAARAEKILICDHDDEVRPGWVTAIAAGLDHADLVGGVAVPIPTSTLDRPTEFAQHAPKTLPTACGYLPYALGGCLGVRRSVALAVGGFDSAFLRGHDEVDFSWRVQQSGFTISGAPSAVLDYRQPSRARDAARQRFHSARTQILLWCRFHETGQLNAISFRAALRNLVRSLGLLPRLIPHGTRFETARTLGWVFGTVDGHLRYRIVGRPAAPILMTGGDFVRSWRGPGTDDSQTLVR